MARRALLLALSAVLLAGCGTGDDGPAPQASASDASPPVAHDSAGARVRDWPMFGVTAARRDRYSGATGIGAGAAPRLVRTRVKLPGTVDSSPIFLHDVRVEGRRRDVVVVTTTYGRTLALAAYTGKTLWRFDPPGTDALVGSSQITNASPASDRRFVYAASPTGFVDKIRLSDGRPATAGPWPVRVTLLPTREKLPSALAISGADVMLTTDGYIGDAPPYQSHYVAIDRRTGRSHIFNALCSGRRRLQQPSSCPQSGGGDVRPWAARWSIAATTSCGPPPATRPSTARAPGATACSG